MRFKYCILSVYVILIVVYFSACKSNTEPGGQQSEIESSIIDGWTKFLDQNYDDAISIFRDAATKETSDKNQAIIRTGLGWSMAYKAKGSGLKDQGYLESIQQFEKAMELDTTYLNSYAGACLVYNVRNSYQESVESGDIVIAKQQEYQFKPLADRASLLDYRHIRLALAESSFYLGNYEQVVEQLDIIDPGVTHDMQDPEGLMERIRAVTVQLNQ